MVQKYEQSVANYSQAVKRIPGGVNSPVRAFKSVGMNPIYVDRAQGSKVTDVDGHTYIDYIGSWGPLILGHAHPQVISKIEETLRKGTSFGLPTSLETEMAELVCERMPSVEMVRMVNSGTEATMSALRLARAYTNRSLILKFEGSYHGHSDSLLIKAGSGVATLGLPDSPGVPENIAKHTITVPFNDIAAFQEVMQQYGREIATVIVEPVAGNMGVVPPKPGFLKSLREETEKYGIVLIFDEVMTGFRVGYHSAQGKFDIIPDLTTMGKVIGGGLPVGAYGGKKEIMSLIAPVGPVYQAGTLSGNPLAMAAGVATLQHLSLEVYQNLEGKSARLAAGILQNAAETEIPIQINRVGSMVGVFFSSQPVEDYQSAKASNVERFREYYRFMLEEGVLLAPSQFEGMFVSAAHSTADIEYTITANRRALEKLS